MYNGPGVLSRCLKMYTVKPKITMIFETLNTANHFRKVTNEKIMENNYLK